MGQLAESGLLSGSGADPYLAVAAVPSIQLDVPSSSGTVSGAASISLSQISEVSTAFGGLRSLVSRDGGAATSSKPGNELSKDHVRVLETFPKLKAHGRRYKTLSFLFFSLEFCDWGVLLLQLVQRK